MAIYRPRRSLVPTIAGAALVGLLVGLLVGYISWANRPPDLDAATLATQTALREAASLLEVVQIEYSEAVGPDGVASESELGGARAALSRSRERYDAVANVLGAIAPDRAAAIGRGYATLDDLVGAARPENEVAATIGELEDLLGAGD